jgi:hypothetical protein
MVKELGLSPANSCFAWLSGSLSFGVQLRSFGSLPLVLQKPGEGFLFFANVKLKKLWNYYSCGLAVQPRFESQI